MSGFSFHLRAMYLFAFGTALWAGFFTYRFFVRFMQVSGLNKPLVLLNTVVLLVLWSFTLTSRSDFIRENIYAILLAPLFAVYATDLYFAYTTNTVNLLLPFIGVNIILFIASERFGTYECRMKKN
jgi:hypothetical protein